MRSKGFPFIVGGLGVGPEFASRACVVSSFVVVSRRLLSSCRCNSVPMRKISKGVIFGGFKCDVASFCVAGVALCDMWTCLVTCRKSFCVAGALLLRRFHNMSCSFVAGAALGTCPSSFIFFVVGAAFRTIVLRVFCELHWQGCAKW